MRRSWGCTGCTLYTTDVVSRITTASPTPFQRDTSPNRLHIYCNTTDKTSLLTLHFTLIDYYVNSTGDGPRHFLTVNVKTRPPSDNFLRDMTGHCSTVVSSKSCNNAVEFLKADYRLYYNWRKREIAVFTIFTIYCIQHEQNNNYYYYYCSTTKEMSATSNCVEVILL